MMLDADLPSAGTSGLERLDEVAKLADEAARSRDTAAFYAALRASDLPFLLRHHRDDPAGLFATTVSALHRLGESSPAIALGVSQHMASMLAFGLARSLLGDDDSSSAVVGRLLDEVFERRLLIANTTSHAGGKKIGAAGSRIERIDDAFVVEGHSTFMSLATEADKVIFLTRTADNNLVGVVADLADPALRISEDLLFGEHLALADTRKLHFNKLTVPKDNVIGPDVRLNVFYNVQLIAHNLCVAALYLGGAFRILQEVKRFGRETELPSGSKLMSSESFSANVGRLAIAYSSSLRLLLSASRTAEDLYRAPSIDQRAAGAHLLSVSSIKYSVARQIEFIAAEGRKLIGTRAFMGDHPVARIAAEVVFAALGPATEKLIELNVGARYLEA
ncbi:MAG: hypothetical protein IRZ07_01585 [Microbispora sp.]|nr:hypothetical protein [Microbispora sp.]